MKRLAIPTAIFLFLSWALLGAMPSGAHAALHVLRADGALAIVDDASSDGVFSWQLDFGGGALVEEIFQQWFWYRVGTGGRETSIDRLTLNGAVEDGGRSLVLSYGAAQFALEVTFELRAGGIGSGLADLVQTVRITNLTGAPLDFHLFELVDFDIDETATDDNVTVSGRVAQQWDTSNTQLTETVIFPAPSRHGVGFFDQSDDIFAALEDASPTDLNGVSSGFGDLHYGFQWDLVIPSGEAAAVRVVKHLGHPALSPLALTKADGGACVESGSQAVYDLCFDNLVNGSAVNGVTLVDHLPGDSAFVAASGGGVYDPAARSVSWTVGTVAGGAAERCEQLTLQVNAPPGAAVTNVAEIDGDEVPASAVSVETSVCAGNEAPAVTNPGDQVDAEGDAVGLQIQAADPDGDPLTYAAQGLPPGLTIDPATGLIQGALPFDAAGSYAVTVRVSDGTAEGTAAFSWTVTETNRAPAAADDGYAADEDTPLAVPAPGVLTNDSDPDGDPLGATLVTAPTHGTLTLAADGSFTYAPDPDYHGTDSFTYAAGDGALASAPATVTLTVRPVNDRPSAADDGYLTQENEALTVSAPGVLGNDADPDGDPLAAVLVTGVSHGILTLEADGSFVYTPADGFNGTDSFTYRADDGALASGPATVTLTVRAVNDPPVAAADRYATDEDVPLTVAAPGVLGNDTDPDGDALTAEIVAAPAHGVVTLQADGSFTYTPAADYHGPDAFTYRAGDGELASAPATVALTVRPVNDPPAAADDSAATAEDTPVPIPVLANDADPDGDSLTVTAVGTPSHGTATLHPDGTVTYTPDADYHGADSFSYTVSDGQGGSATASVAVTVTPVNDPPAAADDAYAVSEGAALTVAAPGVLGNDTDPDGDALTAALVTAPAHGTLTLAADGSFTYVPEPGFNGTDAFTYRTGDGALASAPATVTLTVRAVNDPPVAAADSYATDEDAPLTVAAPGVLGNDTDPDGDALTAEIVAAPAHGAVTLQADGSFTYTPSADYHGPDSFTYRAGDGELASAPATVALTVRPVNDPPAAADDSAATAEDTPVPIPVLANDADPDGDGLTVTAVGTPSHGTATLHPDGTVTYTPDADYHGADSFSYTVSDGQEGSATASVAVTVTPVNDPPAAADDLYGVDENGSLVTAAPGVLANDTDPEGDPLTAALAQAPAHGSVDLAPDGSFTYVPEPGFHGEDAFTYRAADGSLSSPPATVRIAVRSVNDGPTAGDDAYSTDEDTPLVVAAPGVLGNDTDPDGDPLAAALVDPAAHGTVTLQADGSFTYAPEPDYHGSDRFTYRASDGKLPSNLATVSIAVAPVNDAPAAADDGATTAEDAPVTVTVLANDADPDGDPLAVADVGAPAHGTAVANPDGTVTYTPAADYHGPDAFPYTVSDGQGGSASATVRVTVTEVNDLPAAGDDGATTAEDTPVTVAVLANDADPDGDPLAVTGVGAPAHGTAAANPDGTVTYRPAPNYHGPDGFSYTVSDGRGGVATAAVAVTVTPEADAPEGTPDGYTVSKNATLTVAAPGVLGNDGDPDGDPLTAELVSGVAHGSLTLASDGSFTYVPETGFSGTDGFTYRASDGALTSGAVAVSITVRDVNLAPSGTADAYTTNQATALVVTAPGVLANDLDPDGDPLTAVLANDAFRGTVELRSDGSFTYTPIPAFSGKDFFYYRVSDGELASAKVKVTVNVIQTNQPPVANDDRFTVAENGTLTVDAPGVLANDGDADGDALTAQLAAPPAHGTLTLDTDGSFTYRPAPGFSGSDSFTYRAADALVTGNVATVVVEVSGINEPPVARDDSFTAEAGTTLTVSAPGVLGNDSDPDGDPLTATLASGPAHGSLTLDPDGGFAYTPTAGFLGADSFSYTVGDGSFTSPEAVVTLTVREPNRVPTAVPDAYGVDEDTALVVSAPGVLGNDTDPDGDALRAALLAPPAHGTLDLAADGSFTYTPEAGFHGTDTFTYTAGDGRLTSSGASVAVTVRPVNDPPQGTADSYVVIEETPLTVAAPGVLGNDSDPDGDALRAEAASLPAHGTLTLGGDGSFTYVPDPGFVGSDGFTYRASDGELASGEIPVSVTVRAANEPPSAAADAYAVGRDETLAVEAPGVLANDTDPEGDALTAQWVSGPAHGTLDLRADGSFTYVPEPGFEGSDGFTYRASDGQKASSDTAVSVTVRGANQAPLATPDFYSADSGVRLEVAAPGVLANDSDPDGDPLAASVVSGPFRGTLDLRPDGSFTYASIPGFQGKDFFYYRVDDGELSSGSVKATIQVVLRNQPPIANDDIYLVNENRPLTVAAPGVLGNDGDPDGDPLTATLLAGPAHGTLTLNPDGSFVYEPDGGFNGADGFTYSAHDGTVGSNPATVSLTVSGQNDPPVSAEDRYAGAMDTPLAVGSPGVLGNDSDPDGDPLTAQLVTAPAHGTLTLNPDGSFVYTPEPGFAGTDGFTYRADDGELQGPETTVTLTVQVPNRAPQAGPDAYTTDEDRTLQVPPPGVLGNDADPDGDPLEAALVEPPPSGALTLNPDGSFTFTPEADFYGTVTFGYVAGDGELASPATTVTLQVVPVNDAPRASADSYGTGQGESLAVAAPGVLANDTDPDGDPLQVVPVSDVAHGTLSLGPDGSFTYTPEAGFVGTDSFSYRAGDGALESAPVTVTLLVRSGNTPPTASDDRYVVDEGGALTVAAPGMLANDVDPDGDALSVVLVTHVSFGTLSAQPDGSFVYTPEPGFTGADGFVYQASDRLSLSNTAMVRITVNPVNTPPVAVADAYEVDAGTALTVGAPGVLANDLDGDGDPLTAALTRPPEHGALTLAPDGSFVYTPAAGFAGVDGFDYRANDGSHLSDPVSVAITVRGVNRPPVASADSYATAEGRTLSVPPPGVLGNDSDPDGDPLAASLVSGPAHGTLTLHPDGSFTYAPEGGFVGADTFTYRAADGAAASDAVAVTITVTSGTNAPPVAVDDAYETSEDASLLVAAPGVLGNDVDPEGEALAAILVQKAAHGRVLLGSDGTLVYIPFPGFTGTDRFTYRASDGETKSAEASVTVEVTAAGNRPPAVAGDGYETPQDTPLLVAAPGVLGNDTDPDGDPLTAVLETGPSRGTVALGADGGFTYTPDAGFAGTDAFTYRASDGELTGGPATVTVRVTAPVANRAPVAAADAYATHRDLALTVAAWEGLLANDRDPDGDPLTAQLVQGPAHGTLTLSADGSFAYVPDAGFEGTDAFTYRAGDGELASADTPVTVTVEGRAGGPPVAVDDAYATDPGAMLILAAPGVLANDQDPDGDPLTAELIQGAAHGRVRLSYDGALVYIPDRGFQGIDRLSYRVWDGRMFGNAAEVTVAVGSAENRAPAAADDRWAVEPGGVLDVPAPGVLANDADPDGDPLHATLVQGAAHGEVVLQGDGSFRYVPDPGFQGEDAFRYTAGDGELTSAAAAVTLEVRPANGPPVAAEDGYQVEEDRTLSVAAPGVLANDADPEGDPLAAELVAGAQHGAVTLSSDGSFQYAPEPGFHGVDGFTYRAGDGELTSPETPVTITVTPVNDPPVAVGDAYTTGSGEPLDVAAPGVLANDRDLDGDALTAVLLTGVSHGTLSLQPDGSFRYVPDPGFSGTDGFTYQALDGEAAAMAAVTLTVRSTNAAPTAADDAYETTRDTPLTAAAGGGVLANDADPDGDALEAWLAEGPAHGTLTLYADGSFTYRPDPGFTGLDRFTYRASDGAEQSALAAVTVSVVSGDNRAPLAAPDAYAAAPNTLLIVPSPGVLANDADPDGDALTAVLEDGTAHGRLRLSTDGIVVYIPDPGFVGTDTFTYRARDGERTSAPAQVTLTVGAP